MTNLFDPTLAAAAAAAPKPVIAAFAGLGDDTWFAASSALAPASPVVVPNMVRPFHPWQATAFIYANDSIARWGGALLGDDMGLGKTAVILALAAERNRTTGRPVIIVAPPVTEGGYITELQACFPHLTMVTVRGHKRYVPEAADLYFISDDSRTMKTWLCDVHTDAKGKQVYEASAFAQAACLIARDEVHRDKGANGTPSGRTRTMLAIGNHCRATGTPIVAATGTLLTNRPVDGFFTLQIVGGESLMRALVPGSNSPRGYLWRYCAPTQGMAAGGRRYTTYGADFQACVTLHEYLRRTVYVRREKSDLGEGVLPHSGWIVKPLALPDGTMRRYQRVEHDFFNLCAEERGKVWADKVGRAAAVVQMGMLREEAGVAKAEAAADYIQELVEDGEQVVAFYVHTRVWEKLALALLTKGISTVTINGDVTGQDRIDAIAEFQAGDAQVCIAQIQASGIGVTLTAAPHAVFVQVPWSAGDLKQAADRILRCDEITRQRAEDGGKVTWHVLQTHYADGDPTFDSAIFGVLERKAAVCDAVNAGRPVTMDEDSVQHEALMAWEPSKRHYSW